MATIKSYTDIEQSKKLAEILPLKSADMRFCFSHTLSGRIVGHYPMIGREPSSGTIPCWSLAALLNVLPQIGGIKPVLDLETNCIQYPSDIDLSITADNSVDACYEMILKLHKLNLL